MMLNNKTKELDYLVTNIKKQRNQYTVTFLNSGEETVHKFNEDQMVEYRITLNKWFLKEDFDQIIKSSNYSKWYNKSLNYIFIKPRTKKEIYDYLDKSELEDFEKNKIVSKLLEYKYLDDIQYVKEFLENALAKQMGIRLIRSTLERKGIDKQIINEYLEYYEERDLVPKLTAKFQKIEQSLITYPILKQKLKLTEKMARMGLKTSTIQETLKNIEFTEDLTNTFSKDLNKIKKQTNDKNKIINKLLRLGYTYDYIKRQIDV